MIGEKVRTLRQQRMLSTVALADIADMTRQTVENVENNKVRPRLDTMAKLAKALGLKSIKELFE